MSEKQSLGGLSPSSLAQFQSCQRKYYYRKIANLPYDKDCDDDVESLKVGKAFHKCLEDTSHNLDGYSYEKCVAVVKEFELNEDFHGPLIFTMLKAYKSVHLQSGLAAVKCEFEIETPIFHGFIDVVLIDAEKNWYIGDMKTAAAYNPGIVPTFPKHPQLNLYAAHRHLVADALGLDAEKFKGCRYRLTTKSKLQRKEDTVEEFIKRLSKTVKSYDFNIPLGLMDPDGMFELHRSAKAFIDQNKANESAFQRNFGSCFNYYRPCEYYSQCHSACYTEFPELSCIVSE